jgi:[acyl-carrier-protein] S-malonyltransferase
MAKRTVKGATTLSVGAPAEVDNLLEALSHASETGAVHEGEMLYAIERLVVSPTTGVFEPGQVDEDTTIERGQVIGTVGNTEVRSAFAGRLQGLLALAGERVTTSQPLAWLRTGSVGSP